MKLPDRFIHWTMDENGLKYPCDSRLNAIDAHDPKNWRTYAKVKASAGGKLRVGWVLNTEDDTRLYGPNRGWSFLDLDKCAVNGEWDYEAQAIYLAFPDALREVSQSGIGLHILGMCDPSKLTDRRNKWDGWKEFYTDKRLVGLTTITGDDECGGTDYTDMILKVVPEREYLGELPDGIDPAYTGPEDDEELIRQMLASSSATAAFGGGVTFRDIWEGNGEKLGTKYPAYNDNDDFDHSSADMALMTHLAFWTGKDMPRMDRLFRRSALIRRKYENRGDYRRDTIQGAVRLCNRVYDRAPRDTSDLTACHADMSHDELARTIYAQRWASGMHHIPEIDRWAEWNGKRWRLMQNDKEQITRLRQDLRDVPGTDDNAKRKRLGDNKTIMAVNALMKTNEGAPKPLAEWDADPFILGTPAQVVDLRTGETRVRSTADFLLRSTHCDPAPSGTKPALWLKFLETVTGSDADLQDFIHCLSGYSATGSTKEHKLFFAFGKGRNGKSTWLNTLHTILSEDYAAVIPAKLLLDKKTEQHATDLAHLDRARLARASELPVGKVWDEALLKQITGGDRITARKMRQDNFTFTPQCTLIVDANNAPSVRGIDEAFRRRMCIIPFDVTISNEQVDQDLSEKLMEEAPAILRWIIDGAVKWYEDGLQIPDRITTATNSYLEEEDTFGAFLEETFKHDADARITNAEIHSQFQMYMARLGLPSWSPSTLSKEMIKRNFKPFKSGAGRGFHGLCLKNQTPKMPFLP